MPRREFCGLRRVSVKLPAWVFPYGMLPNLVPMPEPGLVERETDVMSMNPTGVIYASPIFNCNGELESPCGGATAGDTGGSSGVGGATGAGGMAGVLLATSPMLVPTSCFTIDGCVAAKSPAF